ncbi:hypothetical protein HD806DRAFT_523923 [Xylariaceae sp. AK1471]|nr:hypothetical protein HD806DRAFT_523923 [Xylariaceae sp. AK1471]
MNQHSYSYSSQKLSPRSPKEPLNRLTGTSPRMKGVSQNPTEEDGSNDIGNRQPEARALVVVIGSSGTSRSPQSDNKVMDVDEGDLPRPDGEGAHPAELNPMMPPESMLTIVKTDGVLSYLSRSKHPRLNQFLQCLAPLARRPRFTKSNTGRRVDSSPSGATLNLGSLAQENKQGRKRANSSTATGPSPKRNGNLSSSQGAPTNSLRKRAQVNAARAVTFTSTPAPSPKSDAKKKRARTTKPTFTRAEEQEKLEDNFTAQRADGKHLYLRLPAELRPDAQQPNTKMIVDACVVIGTDPDQISGITYLDERGRMVRMETEATASFFNNKYIKLKPPRQQNRKSSTICHDEHLKKKGIQVLDGKMGTQDYGKTSGPKLNVASLNVNSVANPVHFRKALGLMRSEKLYVFIIQEANFEEIDGRGCTIEHI